jgi:hypothetical protein
MKLFLIKILRFSSLFLGILIVGYLAISWLSKKNADFKIKPTTTNILLGHSHAECAYNDSIINNFENFALSGESYFYTLPKVKEIVKQNPGIKTVFLEFTNNQITVDIEKWIFEEKYLNYYYALYNPYIEIKDHFRLMYLNPAGFVGSIPVLMKDLIKKTYQNTSYPYEFGGYKGINGSLEDYQLNKNKHKKEDFIEIDHSVSELQLLYLRKIIDFLKEKNIEIILIRTPQYKSYQGFSNEKEYQSVLKKELLEIKHIDLCDFPITANEFRDPEHVNVQGAKFISEWMNELIKMDLKLIFNSSNHLDYSQLKNIQTKRDR